MIEILKSYFTKNGKKVVVLDYKNGKYLCNDAFGNKFYLLKDDFLLYQNKIKIIEPEYNQNITFSEQGIIDSEFILNEKENEVSGNFQINVEENSLPIIKDVILENEESQPKVPLPLKNEVEEDEFYEDLL